MSISNVPGDPTYFGRDRSLMREAEPAEGVFGKSLHWHGMEPTVTMNIPDKWPWEPDEGATPLCDHCHKPVKVVPAGSYIHVEGAEPACCNGYYLAEFNGSRFAAAPTPVEPPDDDEGLYPRPSHEIGYWPRVSSNSVTVPAAQPATPEDLAAQRESWGKHGSMRGERQAMAAPPVKTPVIRLQLGGNQITSEMTPPIPSPVEAEQGTCKCGHDKSIHEFEDDGAASCCMAKVWAIAVGAGEPKPCMCSGYASAEAEQGTAPIPNDLKTLHAKSRNGLAYIVDYEFENDVRMMESETKLADLIERIGRAAKVLRQYRAVVVRHPGGFPEGRLAEIDAALPPGTGGDSRNG